MNKFIRLGVLLTGLVLAGNAMACGGEASGKHIGNITAHNSGSNTFTIMDMQSQSPITFRANAEIMAAVQRNPSAQVMVNYEENDEGALQAIGITF